MNDKNIYLLTKVESLDKLLSPDSIIENPHAKGGFLLHTDEKNRLFETPVILIEGATGAGKTILALQIAFKVIEQKSNNIPWRVYFYSLEQSKYALEDIAVNFGWMKSRANSKFNDFSFPQTDPDEKTDHLNLCHFSPHPPEENEDGFVFEQRKTELQHAIKHVCGSRYNEDGSENFHPLFVLDSLTAFADRNLTRSQIYRLFEVFRAKNVPAIMTVEKYSNYTSAQDTIPLESAKYLADIVIDLSMDNSDYFKYKLEIIKSKVCRQGLGKHLYKIRTKTYAETSGNIKERGIVLYPSIHFELSNIRKNEPEENLTNEPADNLFRVCSDDDSNEILESDDLHRIFNQRAIEKGNCVAILGPAGSHKLALAVNIAIAHHRNTAKDKEKAKILIISFGNTSDFNFKKMAWMEKNEPYNKLEKDKDEKARGKKVKEENDKEDDTDRVKYWHDEYCITGEDGNKTPVIAVTTFRMGQLSSEECFHVIEKKIMEKEDNGAPQYSAVILANTAEISTSFPQLAKEPLFLPSLIELFSDKKIVSVCICVKTELSSSIEGANLAVLSKANYRIFLSQYPTIEELSRNLVLDAIGEKNNGLKEQLTSLVIDNVSGKKYSRAPIWLRVEKGGEETNILHCTDKLEFIKDEVQKTPDKDGQGKRRLKADKRARGADI